MSNDMNLPQLESLSNLLITSDDLGRAKEAEFVASIQKDKVKMLVTNNKISCVMIAPEVYTAFMQMSERVLKGATEAATK